MAELTHPCLLRTEAAGQAVFGAFSADAFFQADEDPFEDCVAGNAGACQCVTEKQQSLEAWLAPAPAPESGS